MIQPFKHLSGIAAPFALANIDTDKILPSRFLKTISRHGLAEGLFYSMRFNKDGSPRPEFALNQPPWNGAQILVALDNFGCGSSREHAPWALLSFGFRCIIAPSFADIFYNNCVKNGILPITLERTTIERIIAEIIDASRARMSVDLESQTITSANGDITRFAVPSEKRQALLLGLDDIDRSLHHEAAITAHEHAGVASYGRFTPTIPPFGEWSSAPRE